MGAVLEAAGFINYDLWMPDENPTFYIPSSLVLTAPQRRQLQEAGFQQGEPFVLTEDGHIVKPESKKFALKSIRSGLAIQKDSLVFYEESTGKFSLEFYYYTDVPVELEIFFYAKDSSSETHLK